MILLYILLLAISLIVSFISSKKGGQFILFALKAKLPFLFMMLVSPAVIYGYAGYQMVIFVEVLYLFSQILFISIYFILIFFLIDNGSVRKNKTNYILAVYSEIRLLKIRYACFFLSISFAFLILVAYNSVGVGEWLHDPRYLYQYGRKGLGVFYSLSMLFFGLSFTIACLKVASNSSLIFFVMTILFYVILASLFGQRMLIFETVWAGYTALMFARPKLRSIGFSLYAVTFLALIILVVAESFPGLSEVVRVHYPHMENTKVLYQDLLSGYIPHFNGEVFFSSFWQFVPRGLYEEKPFEYGKTLINAIYFPGQAEATHTPAYTKAAPFFADFGYLGVILSGFNLSNFLIAIYLAAFRFVKDVSQYIALYFVSFLVFFGPGFINFLPDYFELSFGLMILIVYRFCVRKRTVLVKNFELRG